MISAELEMNAKNKAYVCFLIIVTAFC